MAAAAATHHGLLSFSQQCSLTPLRVRSCCHLRGGQQLFSSGIASFASVMSKYPAVECDNPVVYRRVKLPRPRAKPEEDEQDLDVDLSTLNDEELDALFEEYGEVVRSDSGINSPTREVDEDAESLALAIALAEAANEVKGAEIRVLNVKPLVYWTKFFVIATAFSRPQVDAMGKKMRDIAEERFKRIPRGDLKPNTWTLQDYGDVVVHIFLPKERAFYNLEEFYGNAAAINLQFPSQVC